MPTSAISWKSKAHRLLGSLLVPTTPFADAPESVERTASGTAVSDIARGEQIDFFRTAARLADDGRSWLLPIAGRLYRPLRRRARHALIVKILDKGFRVAPEVEQQDRFDERIDLLLADNKGRRTVVVRLAGVDFALPPSTADGYFAGTIRVDTETVASAAVGGRVGFYALVPAGDERRFESCVLLVPPVGRSIISDIDDTVRVTGVESKSRMLRTTLLEPFEAVCGMATVFRNWVAEGATLHFVSSTPWHFNGPLLEFFAAAGFPPATLALKKIRLKDRSIRNILADASRTKPPKLEALLSAYPERTFVLVGDSGEKDPEIYADLLRRHPSRIERVLIRNLAGAGLDSERFQAVFEGIDPGRWQLFVDAAELPASLRA